jgi:serine/threonine protein kinase
MTIRRCWRCDEPARVDAAFCSCAQRGEATPLQFSHFVVKGWLGAGAHGTVYACTDTRDGSEVAVKKLDRSAFGVAGELLEQRVPRRLTHPHIVQILDVLEEDGAIVMELVRGRTLRDALENDPKWLRREFYNLMPPIVEALRAAHAEKIIHRDIKPENILISNDGVAKLTDFGVCKFLETTDYTDGYVGSPPYMATEVLAEERYGLEADLHSLGCVFYEIWAGHLPWTANGQRFAYFAVKSNVEPEPLTTAAQQPTGDVLSEVVARMITSNPTRRIMRVDLVAQQLRLADPSPNPANPSIDELATILGAIYGYANNDKHPLYLLSQFMVSTRSLAQDLLGAESAGPNSRLERSFPKTFAWLCAVASSMNVGLGSLIWLKFDGRCPYCLGATCTCDPDASLDGDERNRILLERLRERHIAAAPEARTFEDYRAMFDRIYGDSNQRNGTPQLVLHMYSEVGEAIDAVLHLSGDTKELAVLALHLEVSDLAAWYFAAVNSYVRMHHEYDFLKHFDQVFNNGCYSCNASPCQCSEPIGAHEWQSAFTAGASRGTHE